MSGEPSGDWLEAAEKLARRILAERVAARDGSPTWIGPGLAPSGELRLRMQLNSQLYTGTTGVALFLAAMAGSIGGEAYGSACLETLHPLRRLLAELSADPERAARLRLGIGAATGFGGFVYALAWAGKLLKDEGLAAEARATAAFFTPARIAADRELDLLGGSAGAILVLLGLSQDAAAIPGPAQTAEELAERCGRHLAAAQDPQRGGWRRPARPERLPLGGWAHGAAGGAYSLARLGAACGKPEFTAAARIALAYDRSLYSATERNWRDLRFESPTYALGWCHGAPGIALSRLELAKVFGDDPVLQAESCIGLETAFSFPLLELDHLCCGNAGLAAIAAAGGRGEDAASRFSALLRRAAARGYFCWYAGQRDDSVFDPSLFKGAAGLGLALLRASISVALPNPLIFD